MFSVICGKIPGSETSHGSGFLLSSSFAMEIALMEILEMTVMT